MAKDIGDLRLISTDEGLEFYTYGNPTTLTEGEVSQLIGHLAHWLALRSSEYQRQEIGRLKSKVNLMIITLDKDGRYVTESEKEK